MAIRRHRVREVVEVELEVAHAALIHEPLELGCEGRAVLCVGQREVGEVPAEVGIRHGLGVALRCEPADVVGRLVERHPEAERRALPAERGPERREVGHASRERPLGRLPNAPAILPAVVGHHGVEPDTALGQRRDERPVDRGQRIAGHILARRVEPVVVVGVGAGHRPQGPHEKPFRRDTGGDGRERDLVALDPHHAVGAGGRKRKVEAADKPGPRIGIEVGPLEVDEAVVAHLLEPVGVGRGRVAVGVPREGGGIRRHEQEPAVDQNRLTAATPGGGRGGRKPLDLDGDWRGLAGRQREHERPHEHFRPTVDQRPRRVQHLDALGRAGRIDATAAAAVDHTVGGVGHVGRLHLVVGGRQERAVGQANPELVACHGHFAGRPAVGRRLHERRRDEAAVPPIQPPPDARAAYFPRPVGGRKRRRGRGHQEQHEGRASHAGLSGREPARMAARSRQDSRRRGRSLRECPWPGRVRWRSPPPCRRAWSRGTPCRCPGPASGSAPSARRGSSPPAPR